MLLKIKLSKLGNHLYFIYSLFTQWHFKKTNNKSWGSGINHLKRKYLEDLYENLGGKTVLLNLIPYRKISEIKTKRLGEKISFLKTLLLETNLEFEKIWKEHKESLKKWQIKLSREIKKVKFPLIKKILSKLSILYKTKSLPKKIEVHLLLSSPIYPVKGWGIEKNKIGLHCSLVPLSSSSISFLLEIIIHEIIHVSFEQKHFYPLLRKFIRKLPRPENLTFLEKGFSLDRILDEMIVSSLIPEGYLGQKYFGKNTEEIIRKFTKTFIPRKTNLLSFLRKVTANKLTPLIHQYLMNKRPFDISFIRNAFSIYLEYRNKLPGAS